MDQALQEPKAFAGRRLPRELAARTPKGSARPVDVRRDLEAPGRRGFGPENPVHRGIRLAVVITNEALARGKLDYLSRSLLLLLQLRPWHVAMLAPRDAISTSSRGAKSAIWTTSLGPIAEHVAHVFGKAMAGSYSAATPLTSRRHRDAQAVVKARKIEATRRAAASRILQRPAVQPTALALWTCPECGAAVTNPRHVRCDACISADPASTPEIRGRRGAAIAARKRALTEWDRANTGTVYDPDLFRREILPRLGTVPLAEIMEAAGFCKASPSDYRRGKRTPHVSTWKALAAIVDVDLLELSP